MTPLRAVNGVEMRLLRSPSASQKMELSTVRTRISGLALLSRQACAGPSLISWLHIRLEESAQ